MASMDLLVRLNYARYVLIDQENNRVLAYFNEAEGDNTIHIFDFAGNKLMEVNMGDKEQLSRETIESIMQEIVDKEWYVGIKTVGFTPVEV